MPSSSHDALLKTAGYLDARAATLEGAKSRVHGPAELRDHACAALAESAAILRDAASEYRRRVQLEKQGLAQ